MEAKRSSSTNLPEELVAKIIAMMPFPSIFKARMLSKTWLARLAPILPDDQEQKQQHRATRSQARKSLVAALQKQVGAAAFQREVLERSANWPIFFPFKWGRSDSWAYELASHTWRSLPSLSFLPENIRRDCEEITTAGALLLLYNCSRLKRKKLYMANIFTRTSKVLPPRPKPEISATNLRHAHIVPDPSMQTYKVIVLFEEYIGRSHCECFLQIYSSKSNAWSSKNLGPSTYFFRNMVHLNGVLYWTEGRKKLFAVDCEQGTVTELSLTPTISVPIDGRILPRHQLVVCNSSLVMVLNVMIDSVHTCKLMKIDLGSGRLWEIAIGGPALEYSNRRSYSSQTPVGHGDCIYFGFLESPSGALTYNLPKDEWSCLDISPNLSISKSFWDWIWKPRVFEPGLNLFMPV